MKSFISYSHKDSNKLERLHVHLTQLKREGSITTWTDEEIPLGYKLTDTISRNLESSQVFIALLTPDYIASNYCYEKEFKRAMEMQEKGTLVIIPVILEPCDWLNTPFSKFKALPKDGKPISEWSNDNNAFLDVIQNIRALLDNSNVANIPNSTIKLESNINLPHNYRVKKDFDSIQKIEFIEQSFEQVKEFLTMYLKELLHIDNNIKYKNTKDSADLYECILVNRNKIGAESTIQIKIGTKNDIYNRRFLHNIAQDLQYSIKNKNEIGFALSNDDYTLFWLKSSAYVEEKKRLDSKEIANIIWMDWLGSVGILI